MFLREKTTKDKEKSPMKIYKNGNFRHISSIFGRKKIFLKNWTKIFWALLIRIFEQKNLKKQMMKSRENAKNSVFLAYFWHFWPEKYVFRKRAMSHFRHCHFAPVCKIS